MALLKEDFTPSGGADPKFTLWGAQTEYFVFLFVFNNYIWYTYLGLDF